MFYFVDFYVIPLFNITLIMPVLRGLKDKLEVTRNKCIRFCLKLQCAEHVSNEHFHKLNWLPTNQRFKQCVTSTVFKFVQNKFPSYENEVFRPAENIRINTRNSFLKLNHPFQKTSTGQKGLSYIGLAIWNRLPNILKKIKYLNTFKSKVRHYYLNDLSNPNLSNVGGFDNTLAIIKNVFLFIKQIFLHLFFPAPLTLKDYNENKAIHLFCVILATLFFFSLILLLASTFFICC